MPGTSNHYGAPIDIAVKHGDIYVMSEKATGYDWRMRSRVRVVHAAGAHAFKWEAVADIDLIVDLTMLKN